ncbi:MAG TPA: thioredoxin family protein [Lacibacter sp.]|jgi:thiol-disulfide isomerase/thioredoxin|nr:thioredoxin family protein [Lacibacter sp.]
MKQFIISALMCVCTTILFGQPLNKISKDRNGNPMLEGCCTREALLQEPFASWFVPNYNSYHVDSVVALQLKPYIGNRTFVLFLGTWCGDSKREVPRLYKIFDYIGMQPEQVKLVMVSNHDSAYKQSPTHEEQGKNILRVPTLLVLENGNEINRFVEYPVESLEKDLLHMLSRKGYKHAYDKSK